MFDKRISLPIALAALVLIGGVAFGGGFFLGGKGISLSEPLSADAPQGVDFGPVWKAWKAIDENFVPDGVATTSASSTQEEKNERRVWGMISGLTDSLDDPYSFFLPPSENERFNDDMSGQFEGVGMEIAVKNEVLTVVAPLKGTPADRAGIKAGDEILKINGDDTRGTDVDAAVRKIRGPKGTQVTLTIARDGWSDSREIKVTRDVISVPVITTEAREDGIFVITLATFTGNSPGLFRNALREFIESRQTKLILDLRGNPGGYLDAAVDMASWFLPSGSVIVTEDYAGHAGNIVHRSSGYDIFNDNLKMVVLVDRGSASASEILAEALRYYGVAQMVGTNTFGKGSVQELIPITPETSLKLTVARWLGPNKQQIPISGLTPDVEVEVSDKDIENGYDRQLEKAVEILRAKE